MPLVTVLFVLTTTGAGVLVIQTVEVAKLVVDSKVNPVKLVGQFTITLVPERVMTSCGRFPIHVAQGAVAIPS